MYWLPTKKLPVKLSKKSRIYKRYPVNITRIFRSGIEHLASREDTVEFGDTVRIVGQREALTDVANELGNSMREFISSEHYPYTNWYIPWYSQS